jgi:hypothetical protein
MLTLKFLAILLCIIGSASLCSLDSNMASSDKERTVFFHGFLQLPDPLTHNHQVIGTPSVSMVSFPAAFGLEYVWCATMGPSNFRNDARGQPLIREKKLAFSA